MIPTLRKSSGLRRGSSITSLKLRDGLYMQGYIFKNNPKGREGGDFQCLRGKMKTFLDTHYLQIKFFIPNSIKPYKHIKSGGKNLSSKKEGGGTTNLSSLICSPSPPISEYEISPGSS